MTNDLEEAARVALRDAAAGRPDALLDALERDGSDRGSQWWLAAWRYVCEESDPVLARALAFALAKRIQSRDESAVVRACAVWAVSSWRGRDLAACTNLLTVLDFALDDDPALLAVLRSSAAGLIGHCLSHPAPLVRGAALDTLELATETATAREILHRPAADALVAALGDATAGLDDEGRAQARDLVGRLSDLDLPAHVPAAPRALSRLAFDLEELSDAAPLVALVRRRALLDQAAAESAKLNTAVQTVRFLGDDAPVSAVNALWRFAEAVLRPLLDVADQALAGVALRARPAMPASFPIHTTYEHDNARTVFETLKVLFAPERTRAQLRESIEALDPRIVEAAQRLVMQLEESASDVEVALTISDAQDWQQVLRVSVNALPAVRAALSSVQRERGRDETVRIDASDVPQANTVEQVFQAVDAVVERGRAEVDDISNITTPRQVNYYLHGARVLGLLDDENQPTDRARAMRGLDRERRLELAAVYFEDAPIGRAWRRWAGVDRLPDVEGSTAADFLHATVSGLSEVTRDRRASTLRAWLAEVGPHHYARSSQRAK